MNKESLAAYGYLVGWKVVGAVPENVARAVFNFAARKASGNGTGMPQLRKNLARVVGPENVTRELVVASMKSYARYWLEAFRLPRIAGSPQIIDSIDETLQGREHLEAGLAGGKGVILVLPHTGNWDMAGMYLVNRYSSFTTVAERLKPEVLFNAFVDFRNSLGFEVLAHEGSNQPPIERLEEVLRSGGIVALLGERDLRATGVEVEFFGETTSMPTGAARLAKETGATLLVVHAWFTEEAEERRLPAILNRWVPKKKRYGWGLSASAPVEVTSIEQTVQEVASRMEANIRQHPADWHMLQPLWLNDLDPSRYRRAIKPDV